MMMMKIMMRKRRWRRKIITMTIMTKQQHLFTWVNVLRCFTLWFTAVRRSWEVYGFDITWGGACSLCTLGPLVPCLDVPIGAVDKDLCHRSILVNVIRVLFWWKVFIAGNKITSCNIEDGLQPLSYALVVQLRAWTTIQGSLVFRPPRTIVIVRQSSKLRPPES